MKKGLFVLLFFVTVAVTLVQADEFVPPNAAPAVTTSEYIPPNA